MTANQSADDRAAQNGSTSRSLLGDARRDDPAAWERLVRLYAPLVAAWCRRWRVADQDTPDLLQDVFAAVAGNLHHFRAAEPESNFRGWLATITRNKVRDFYRRQADEPRAAGGTEAKTRLAEFPAIETIECDFDPKDAAFGEVLQRALASIRPEFHERTWQAFWNVVVDGRAAADVAADLAMQPGAVRVSKSRVLSRLRRELELGQP